MLPRSSPERSVLYGRLNREAETLRFAMHDPEKWMPVFRQDHAPLAGITRAGKTNLLSPYSEHLACRSLCRQADARCRPGAGYKSARRHRARPVPRSVLAKNVPSKGAMDFFSSLGGAIQENPQSKAIPLI
jgi:hypothetical protein